MLFSDDEKSNNFNNHNCCCTAGLVDSGVSGTPVYADESETSTEQKIEQENVCSGFAVCSNTADNLIDGGFLLR